MKSRVKMVAYLGKSLKKALTEQAGPPKIQLGPVINKPMVKGSGIIAVSISNKTKLITKSFVGFKIQRCLYTMTQTRILLSKATAVITPKTDACTMSASSAVILWKVALKGWRLQLYSVGFLPVNRYSSKMFKHRTPQTKVFLGFVSHSAKSFSLSFLSVLHSFRLAIYFPFHWDSCFFFCLLYICLIIYMRHWETCIGKTRQDWIFAAQNLPLPFCWSENRHVSKSIK